MLLRWSTSSFGKFDIFLSFPIFSIISFQVGQGCLQLSQAKCTYGTGCFLLYCTGQNKVDSTYGLLTTVAYQLENQPPVYALEGSVAVAGSCLSWLKDNMQVISSIDEIDALVKSVPDNGDVYFVPAFSGLFAPHWDSEARGIICGITEETKRGHIVTAALESVCFQVKDILDAMNLECGAPLVKLKVDGGMTNNVKLMQWQADIIGMEVIKPSMIETTALGAAMFAGHAVGKWNINAKTDIKSRTFLPKISDDERDVRFKKWKMAIERSLGWDQNWNAMQCTTERQKLWKHFYLIILICFMVNKGIVSYPAWSRFLLERILAQKFKHF